MHKEANVFFIRIPSQKADINDLLARSNGTKQLRRLLAKAQPAEDTWPEPEPLGQQLPPVARLTPDMLPPALRGWCVDAAERMQVPLDYIGVAAMASLGMAAMRRAVVYPKQLDDWRIYPNLWGIIIAPPAQKKSPALSVATEPLREIEGAWKREYDGALAEYLTQKLLADFADKQWRKAIQEQAAEPPARPTQPVAPVRKRLLTQDATPEALQEQLAQQPAGMGIVRDELTGLWQQYGREGRQGEKQMALQGWNGDGSYTVDRIGRGNIDVPHLCLAIFGTTQPGPLRAYFAEAQRSGATNDGFLQRHQLAIWPDTQPAKWTNRCPNESAKKRAFDTYIQLANMDASKPKELRFDNPAQQLFAQWWEWNDAFAKSLDLHPMLAEHFAKYPKLVPALALLFALCDSAAVINRAHLALALRWAEYLASHARRIYSIATPPRVEAARTLAGRLQRGWRADTREFTVRDVHANDWAGLATSEEAQAALDVLEDYGWVRKVWDKPTTGRPAKRYLINPKITETYPDIEAVREKPSGGFEGPGVYSYKFFRKNTDQKIRKASYLRNPRNYKPFLSTNTSANSSLKKNARPRRKGGHK